MNITCAFLCFFAFCIQMHEWILHKQKHNHNTSRLTWDVCTVHASVSPFMQPHLFMARRRGIFVKVVQFLEHQIFQPKKMAAHQKPAKPNGHDHPSYPQVGLGFFKSKHVGHLCPKKNNTKKLLWDSAPWKPQKESSSSNHPFSGGEISGRVCLFKSEFLDSYVQNKKIHSGH